MRNSTKAALAATVAMMAATAIPAQAVVPLQLYNFSYDFGQYAPGDTVTGSFTGIGDLSEITNITAVSLTINGIAVTGPITAFSYTGEPGANCGTCFTTGGATVSSNGTSENFVFGNGDTFADSTSYFYIIPGWYNTGPGSTTIAVQANLVGTFVPSNQYNGDYIPQNFSVSVPEPATWAMMLVGMGMVGFAARRRAKVAVAYA